MKERESKFSTALSEAVHEGLDSIGPSIAEAVLFYMNKKAAVQLDCQGLDPEAFDGCLKGLFGWGAEIVEKRILECLYLKLEVRIKIERGFIFADEVKKAQKLLGSSHRPSVESAGDRESSRTSTRKVLLFNKGQAV